MKSDIKQVTVSSRDSEGNLRHYESVDQRGWSDTCHLMTSHDVAKEEKANARAN